MITPEDREANLPMWAYLSLCDLGGNLPQPVTGANSLSGRLTRLGWKICRTCGRPDAICAGTVQTDARHSWIFTTSTNG